MQIRTATLVDLTTIQALEQQATFDEFSAAELQQGISGDFFNEQQLKQLLQLQAIWLLEIDAKVQGYLIMAPFSFHQSATLYRELSRRCVTNDIVLNWAKLSVCGPVWLAPAARGTGAFKLLYAAARAKVAGQVMALVAEHNERSLKAHCQYANMQIVDFMTLAGRDFYLLQD